MGDRLGAQAPRIFYVNWFRKSSEGKWLWPGFGENSRVLKWMCERVDGKAGGGETPIGFLPRPEDLDLSGLELQPGCLPELLRVDNDAWRNEVADIGKFFAQFGNRLPARLARQLDLLGTRLGQ
jgi:phosphoenolpyruvate carboxykinase (GTP)